MNEAQQLDNLWQVLESRDLLVRKALQERSSLYQKCSILEEERNGLRQQCNDLHEHRNDLLRQIAEISRHNSELQTDNESLNHAIKLHGAMIEELREKNGQLTVNLQINQAEKESLQHVIEQRDLTIEDIKETLCRSEENRLSLLKKIDQLQEKLNDSQANIEGMESSKFWQLREFFVKIKNSLTLTRED
ncbi:MAG: hypothetical protein WBM32_08260 [Crocosphaera sp.]